MKILHVVPSISPRYGGPSAVIGPMCAALARQSGTQVELATTDADGPHGRLDSVAVPSDFPVHIFPRTFSERWKYSRDLGRWLKTHARDYDVIHAHALWTYSTDAAARAAHRAGVPYILRPAGMLSQYSLARHRWQKRLYWSLVEGRTTVRAACLHATSSQEQAEIRRCLPAARVEVIPNGVEDTAWQVPPNPDLLRSRCGTVCRDRLIVLFLSRLHPKKGLTDLLLPAWQRLQTDALLVIVGGQDEHAPEYAAQVEQAIRQAKLENRVACLGPCDPAERWAMLDAADVFVLPSHSENFGIAVAEAMARGRAVVVTDTVQSCEHVAAARSGIIVPRDVTALAEALNRLLCCREQRQTYGEAGRAHARVNFRWDRIAEQVHEMYKRVARDN